MIATDLSKSFNAYPKGKKVETVKHEIIKPKKKATKSMTKKKRRNKKEKQ